MCPSVNGSWHILTDRPAFLIPSSVCTSDIVNYSYFYRHSLCSLNKLSCSPPRPSPCFTLRDSIWASCWQHCRQTGCSLVRLNSPSRSQELHRRLLEKPSSLQASDDRSAPYADSCRDTQVRWGGDSVRKWIRSSSSLMCNSVCMRMTLVGRGLTQFYDGLYHLWEPFKANLECTKTYNRCLSIC